MASTKILGRQLSIEHVSKHITILDHEDKPIITGRLKEITASEGYYAESLGYLATSQCGIPAPSARMSTIKTKLRLATGDTITITIKDTTSIMIEDE